MPVANWFSRWHTKDQNKLLILLRLQRRLSINLLIKHIVDMRNTGQNLGVYVIGPERAGPCKIGRARMPLRRLADLQIGNHLELKLWSVWASDYISAREVERRAHAVFNDRSIRGEWFNITVTEAELVLSNLDDAKAFRDSKDLEDILLKAMAHHPRY